MPHVFISKIESFTPKNNFVFDNEEETPVKKLPDEVLKLQMEAVLNGGNLLDLIEVS